MEKGFGKNLESVPQEKDSSQDVEEKETLDSAEQEAGGELIEDFFRKRLPCYRKLYAEAKETAEKRGFSEFIADNKKDHLEFMFLLDKERVADAYGILAKAVDEKEIWQKTDLDIDEFLSEHLDKNDIKDFGEILKNYLDDYLNFTANAKEAVNGLPSEEFFEALAGRPPEFKTESEFFKGVYLLKVYDRKDHFIATTGEESSSEQASASDGSFGAGEFNEKIFPFILVKVQDELSQKEHGEYMDDLTRHELEHFYQWIVDYLSVPKREKYEDVEGFYKALYDRWLYLLKDELIAYAGDCLEKKTGDSDGSLIDVGDFFAHIAAAESDTYDYPSYYESRNEVESQELFSRYKDKFYKKRAEITDSFTMLFGEEAESIIELARIGPLQMAMGLEDREYFRFLLNLLTTEDVNKWPRMAKMIVDEDLPGTFNEELCHISDCLTEKLDNIPWDKAQMLGDGILYEYLDEVHMVDLMKWKSGGVVPNKIKELFDDLEELKDFFSEEKREKDSINVGKSLDALKVICKKYDFQFETILNS